jgi:hypothetical protein
LQATYRIHQREGRQREEEKAPGLALLAGAHTDICLERDLLLYVTVAVSWQEV